MGHEVVWNGAAPPWSITRAPASSYERVVREAVDERDAKRPARPVGDPSKQRYWCTRCGRENALLGTLHDICARCRNELHGLNGTPPEVDRVPLASRLRKYGLTLYAYQRMLERQKGACAICKRPELDVGGLVVDHNHDTGKVRGLLCGSCNTALGLLQDSPDVVDAALLYLEERGCYGPNALAEGEAS